MKPATRIQVVDSHRLRTHLTALAHEVRAEVCFETGTHIGMGSTQLLLAVAEQTNIPRIYTMEISRNFFEQARANLKVRQNVECLWGLSVDRNEAVAFVKNDSLLKQTGPEPDIYIDFLPDPMAGYLGELDGAIGGGEGSAPDALLEKLLPSFADRRPLICLDSAGGLGLLEYQTVRRIMGSRPFAIWVDDINHVKHYRSLIDLQRDTAVTRLDLHWEDGWAAARVN